MKDKELKENVEGVLETIVSATPTPIDDLVLATGEALYDLFTEDDDEEQASDGN